jgi:tellurite methyltransferase
MARLDAVRWNERYRQEWYRSASAPRELLVENVHFLPHTGLIFEAALGMGANANFLIQRGLDVIGVDISDVAVLQARQRTPRLQAVIADLEHFYLPAEKFAGILNFYYLDRALFPVYRQALHPGGILFIETLTRVMLEEMPDLDPKYLLAPGELKQAFSGWEILVYREGWITSRRGSHKAVASLVARKP